MLQKAFQVTPVYREISEWDEETGYHMGVYLCLNIKKHEFNPNDDFIKYIDNFISTDNTALENLKQTWSSFDETQHLVVILGESKHKIKKKAEQAARQISIKKLS